MKIVTLFALSAFVSSYTNATDIDLSSIDPEKARAYQAFLLTFEWPADTSTEQVNYKEIKNSTNITSFNIPTPDTEVGITKPATIEPLFNAFDSFNEKVGKHAKVLINGKWTLIFPEAGFTHHESFHSQINENGYVDLSGDISIKLGRYLESDIHYQHYLFNNADSSWSEEPILTSSTIGQLEDTPNSLDSSEAPSPSDTPKQVLAAHRPIQVLDLTLKNKTASKKINYLDHPIIGTLLYFVPMELEDAIEEKALESFTPDLGENKTQEDLTSSELE